jgi:hypothetical protein
MAPAWIHLFLDTPAPRWDAGTAFWSQVSGTTISAARGEHGQFVTLLPTAGDAWLKLQAIRDDRAGVHLDLESADRTAARRESEELGATFAWQYDKVPVMRSPGGLLFCHTVSDRHERPRMARAEAVVADQVCLDIPPPLWDAEVAFWRELTGRTLQAGGRPEFAFLGDPDPAGPPRMLLQRLHADAAEVTAHLDLATASRPEETRRHERFGAQVVRVERHWTVMHAPSGHDYCLTDRDPRTGSVLRRVSRP